ncbi:hypothetical protein G210_3296 [Candida maltosa Xu316]|uniref:Uncharacterized protein n=1 Tax=Candida maltosa (strain Xu316) TaxID=1245528 RepID=M3JVP1_CANMX|nr:hypothetical protein G210_3296 [Candida maltosa Xu316]
MPKVNKTIQRIINQNKPSHLNNNNKSPNIDETTPLVNNNQQFPNTTTIIINNSLSDSSRTSTLIPHFKRNENVQKQEQKQQEDELFPFINFNEFEFSHRGTILNSQTRSTRLSSIAHRNNHNNHHHNNTTNNDSCKSSITTNPKKSDSLSIVSSNLAMDETFHLNIISDDASFQPHILLQNNSVDTSAGTIMGNPSGLNESGGTISSTKNTIGRKLVQKSYTSIEYASDHVSIEIDEEEDDEQVDVKEEVDFTKELGLDEPVVDESRTSPYGNLLSSSNLQREHSFRPPPPLPLPKSMSSPEEPISATSSSSKRCFVNALSFLKKKMKQAYTYWQARNSKQTLITPLNKTKNKNKKSSNTTVTVSDPILYTHENTNLVNSSSDKLLFNKKFGKRKLEFLDKVTKTPTINDNSSGINEVFEKDEQLTGALLYIISEVSPEKEKEKGTTTKEDMDGKNVVKEKISMDKIEESSNDGDDEQSDFNLYSFDVEDYDDDYDYSLTNYDSKIDHNLLFGDGDDTAAAVVD